jgi:uncharacterized coiled-coil protein SlyX
VADDTANDNVVSSLEVRLAQQQRSLAAIEQRLDEMKSAVETLSRAQAGEDHGPA